MASARPTSTKSPHARFSTSPGAPTTAEARLTEETDAAAPLTLCFAASASRLERPARRLLTRAAAGRAHSVAQNSLETLPVEVINHILSYLVHPRSRLPGLTERQSQYDVTMIEKSKFKAGEDKTAPPDSDRHFANIFAWVEIHHPFNDLAATSKRCRELVESYSAHLVKSCNRFNLPFERLERFGPSSVHPSLNQIVYRRLWLQTAPRYCVFCNASLSHYPHSPLMRLRPVLICEACFYAQTLTFQEIQRVYHIRDKSALAANGVRGSPNYEWVLRNDAEALALRLYKTRAFHSTHPDHDRRPCETCRKAGILDEKTKGMMLTRLGRSQLIRQPHRQG